MPKITFVAHDGAERTIEAKNGMSVMEVAVNNSVPGIDGHRRRLRRRLRLRNLPRLCG